MMHTQLIFMGGWCSLMAAIIFGVLGTLSMKLSNGFHRWRPTLAMGIFYSISFAAMTSALQTIPISEVYAIWSGAGTLLVSVLGVFLFNESMSWRKSFFLLMIVGGIIGIQLANGS